jgi:hypothetical protein
MVRIPAKLLKAVVLTGTGLPTKLVEERAPVV